MIDPDCEKCEMHDPDNDFGCKLEETGSYIRCNILKRFVESEFRRDINGL